MIDIQQPQPLDIVSNEIMIAGIAGEAFEASYNLRITEGHDEVNEHFMGGNGMGGHGQFQVAVDVTDTAFKLPNLFIEVFYTSAEDGSELDKVVVPVIYMPVIFPEYTGYILHEVEAGDTLWSLAKKYYGYGKLYHRIVVANALNDLTIYDDDLLRIPQ